LKKLILALSFVIQFLYIIQGVLTSPFATGDAYAIWFLKAKVLYLGGWGGFVDFLKNPEFAYNHSAYPIFLPLLFASIYKLIGQVNEIVILSLYPLVYLGIIFFLFKILKKEVGFRWAYLAVFLWGTVPIVERHAGRLEAGFADFFLAAAILVGTFYAIEFTKTSSKKNLIFAVLGLGIGANIKFEGALWLLSLFLASLFCKKKIRVKLSLPIFLSALAIVPWLFFIYKQHIGFDYLGQNSLIKWQKLPIILTYFLKEIFKIKRWGLALISLFTLIALKWRWLRVSKLKLVFTAIVIQFIGFGLIYLMSPIEISGHLDVSFYRLIVQVLPLLFWVGFNNTPPARILRGVLPSTEGEVRLLLLFLEK